jgi:hypothetical protein
LNDKKKYIDDGAPVTAHIYGDTVELSNSLGGMPIMQKISKDQMVNRQTGEVKDIHHVTSRADPKNYESLRATFKKLRRIIGANFKGGQSELWITLTYKDSPMKDSERLYKDFKIFMKRLRKETGKYLAYIVVIEPQRSGSLHAHLLLKTLDKSRLYIENSVVAQLWGQGFVNVRRLKDSDNVGAYLMAYLTNIDINNLEDKPDNRKKISKKIIKGGRLGLYPINMQIYRRSRYGIVNPIKIKGLRKEIKHKYNLDNIDPNYYRSFEVQRSNDDKPFEIETEYYSIKEAKLKKALDKINRNN